MQHLMRVIFLAFFTASVVGFCGFGSQTARAQSASSSPDGDWQFGITPYVWGAGLDGKVSFAGRGPVPAFDVRVSRRFDDTLSSLDFGGMAFFEARRNRFGVFAEIFSIETTDSTSTSFAIPVGPTIVSAGARLKTSFTTALLAGQYRAIDSRSGSLDLLVGARYWSLDNRVRITEALGSIERGFRRKVSSEWGSPILGAKARYDFTHKAYVTGWAMSGGIGLDDYSSFDLMAAFGYSFTKRFSTLLGYRYLSMDFSESAIDFDADLHGPGIGLDFRF